MAEVIWTEPAQQDLEALAEYIALDNPDAAARLVRRIFERVGMLENYPELGSRIPELRPASRYRQLVESPCRVFYRHDKAGKLVYVLAVMRGERLFQGRLLTRGISSGE